MAADTLSRVDSSSTKRLPSGFSKMAPQPRSFSGANHWGGGAAAAEGLLDESKRAFKVTSDGFWEGANHGGGGRGGGGVAAAVEG